MSVQSPPECAVSVAKCYVCGSTVSVDLDELLGWLDQHEHPNANPESSDSPQDPEVKG